MKKVFSFVFVLFLSAVAFSQEKEEKEKGFKKENVFIGTGVNLGFFNGFILGLNPEIGYSLNKFLDAGVSVNFNYITQNDLYSPTTYRQFTLGGGPFVRVWPVRMIFLGGQFEYNSIKYSVKSGGSITGREKYSAPSLLVGGGYGSRNMGQSQFYTSIMVDVLRNPKSPYIDSYGRMSPVLRTTFTFYLKPKSQRR